MINCPECGKELKHRGALNGHLAFAHGVRTPRGLTLDELRSKVRDLSERVNDLETSDLTEKRSTTDCLYCDRFSVRANTINAENRLLNEHIKQKHPDKPLVAYGRIVSREED